MNWELEFISYILVLSTGLFVGYHVRRKEDEICSLLQDFETALKDLKEKDSSIHNSSAEYAPEQDDLSEFVLKRGNLPDDVDMELINKGCDFHKLNQIWPYLRYSVHLSRVNKQKTNIF